MSPQHNGIDYIELNAADLEAAKAFYSAAFGWEFTDYGPSYTGFRTPGASGGREAGGIAAAGDGVRGGPLVLLWSDDLEATLTAVTMAGGTIVVDPFDFPGGRRFQFTDPAGNELGVWTSASH